MAMFGLARPSAGQLTLRDAFAEADRAAFANRIATGTVAAQRALAIAPLSGVLPNARIEAGYVRTTDPVGVFGSTLRQRIVTTASFDPQRLNDPGSIGNYQTAVVVEQPILNADAWTGRRAAAHAAEATRATEAWTVMSTRVDVIRAYYGAVLATDRVAALRAAARAAHAHLGQAESMVRQGLVTKSDALLASVRAADVEAQLVEAEGAAVTARGQLAVVLGRVNGAVPADAIGTVRMPSAERIRAETAADTAVLQVGTRADVEAAADALSAAHSDEARAKAALVPRINAFARYEWNSPIALSASDHTWTIGILATWTPFAAASQISDIRVAAARAEVARAQVDAAHVKAQLQAEETRTALSVALQRLDIAERAVAQSAEAHRIVSRKYDGGLAGVVDLLDAQGVETQSALAFAQARWTAVVAAAERRRALGLDPATLASLDDSSRVATSDSKVDPMANFNRGRNQ